MQPFGVDGGVWCGHPSSAKAEGPSPLCHLSSHLSLRCEVSQLLDTSPSQYRLSSISGLTAVSHTIEIKRGDNLNVEMH
jgi:hypothetical protein